MQAVHLTAYGDPTQFLHQVELPEPQEPGHDQVLIQVDFSPLNPNDLMLAQGIPLRSIQDILGHSSIALLRICMRTWASSSGAKRPRDGRDPRWPLDD